MNTTGKLGLTNLSGSEFSSILELDQAYFPKPWSPQAWADLNWGHHLLFSWQAHGQTLGFALFSHLPHDDSSHLLKICLRPDLRGLGVSQVFWAAILVELKLVEVKSIFLEVEASNLRAIGFYQKSAFKSLRAIKSYYSDGSDALTMQMTF